MAEGGGGEGGRLEQQDEDDLVTAASDIDSMMSAVSGHHPQQNANNYRNSHFQYHHHDDDDDSSICSSRHFDDNLAREEEEEHADEGLNLPPPIFTRWDRPFEYAFRENPQSRILETTDPVTGEKIRSRTVNDQAKRQHAKFVSFRLQEQAGRKLMLSKANAGGTDNETTTEAGNEPTNEAGSDVEMVPVKPPALLEPYDPNNELEVKLKAMFENRPCWYRKVIEAALSKQEIGRLKGTLPKFAYYYTTGPWRAQWVRYGYDPRSKKEAAVYQLIDFRVPQELRHYLVTINKRVTSSNDSAGAIVLSNKDTTKPMRKKVHFSSLPKSLDKDKDAGVGGTETASAAATSSSTAITTGDTSSSGGEHQPQPLTAHKQEPGVGFTFSSLPLQAHAYYQLCDIQDESIQQQIQDESNKLDIIDNNYGWFKKDVFEGIRTRMIEKVVHWIGEEIGEDLGPVLPAKKRKHH